MSNVYTLEIYYSFLQFVKIVSVVSIVYIVNALIVWGGIYHERLDRHCRLGGSQKRWLDDRLKSAQKELTRGIFCMLICMFLVEMLPEVDEATHYISPEIKCEVIKEME